MTNEQKTYLNEKYDLSKIKSDSHEYALIIGELCQMGILSNLPFSDPLNITSVDIDVNGNIISCMSIVDDINEDADLLDWFSQSLDLNGIRHNKLLENGVSSLADKLFMKQFDSYKSFV